MNLTAIIVANAPAPPHSLVPICLEDMLGDPLLLWQLCALPELTERAYVIAGASHEKIAALISSLKSKGGLKIAIECLGGASAAHAVLELPEAIGAEPEARALLLNAAQPLASPAALRLLASSGGMLAPDAQEGQGGQYGGPISLPWPALRDAAQQLSQRTKDAGFDELADQITKTAQLKRVACGPGDLIQVRERRDLIKAQDIARQRIVARWLDAGVAFMELGSTHLGPRVELAAKGVIIEPNVRLEGRVSVGEGTRIGQGSVIRDSSLGAGVEIRPYCVIDASVVGDMAKIGPFAHLREGSQLDSGVHLGNFVETKKAHLRPGAKANHLSYLGDCEVGERTNVGAGCITCNYDGFKKHRTVIGKDAFIGSDCQLVAPVTVGDGAILGAGTTLTSDAPKDALVLTRPETALRDGGAKRLRAKLKGAALSAD